MATANYEYKLINSEYTTDSSTEMRRNFIGTRMTGVNDDVRINVPKFAKINSATCQMRIKRDGTSDISWYNHDMAWQLYDESNSVVSTLQSQTQVIKRSYTTFSYNCLSYINSENANAGVATSIYCLSFYASGDLSKRYTYDVYKFAMSYTLPTITINASVNNSAYGKVNTDRSFTLGSPIDVSASGSYDAEIYAIPNEGYEFVQWSDGVTDNYRVVEISEDSLNAHNTVFSFTAEFAPKKHTITVTAGTGGSVSGGGTYEHGKTATLTATPATGYKFKQWSDGSTANPRTITVTADATYTAQFKKIVSVNYDNLFNFKRWKETTLATNSGISISNVTETGFTGTALVDDAYTNESRPLIPVENGKTYTIEIDISGGSFELFVFNCDSSGVWSASSPQFTYGNTAKFNFTASTNYVSIRCDAVGTGTVVNYNNFRIYPAGYDYMSSTLAASERTDIGEWSIPTPVRDGYTFKGWNTKIDGSGTTYTAASAFPTSDLVLYSQWEKEETSNLYIGNQRVSAYLGTKKVSVYLGTKKLS